MQNKSENVDKQCTNYENSSFHSFPILELLLVERDSLDSKVFVKNQYKFPPKLIKGTNISHRPSTTEAPESHRPLKPSSSNIRYKTYLQTRK